MVGGVKQHGTDRFTLFQQPAHGNQIKDEAMDARVSSLPETTSGELYVYSEYPYDNKGNIITNHKLQ